MTNFSSANSGRLAGRTAIVTGAGQGVGEGIARRLAAEGASIIINDINTVAGEKVAAEINAAGGKAVGLSGSDANLITAVKATRTKKDPDSNIERVVDLGFVGEPDKVDPSVLTALAAQRDEDFIPVVAPVGVGSDGKSFNINADTAAGAVAAALGAKRVLFLTDVTGVLDKSGNLIKQLTVAEARGLIADGTAKGGMIPKLETAMQAVEKGVEAAVILDGRKPHALLMELFTEHGAGTLVR